VQLSVLDWPIIAAWAAVLGTLIGALYTRAQARSARESLRLAREAKDAALDQANSARDSAESARVSKQATVDQARSARASVEIARRSLDRADRPRFVIKAKSPGPRQTSVPITVVMTDGPPALNVDLLWISEASSPINEGVSDIAMGAGTGVGTYELVLNDMIEVPVPVPEETRVGEIKVVLECSEYGADDRTWTHPEVVRWKRRTPPRVY
jgi:hypothetical protein